MLLKVRPEWIRVLVTLSVAAVCLASPAAFQLSPIDNALIQLTNVATALASMPLPPEQLKPIQSAAGPVVQAAGMLRGALQERKVSERFVKSIDLDTDALTRAREARAPDGIIATAGAVRDDLQTKVGFVQGVKGDVPDVAVSAWTPARRNPLNDYEVWYVPSAHETHPDRFDRFPGLSSPANQPLAPGNYVMWTQRGAAKGDRRPVRVGTGGQDRTSVDLPVPVGGQITR